MADGGGDPPVPIPNTEVKPSSADGTASGGRVGHCQAFFINKKEVPGNDLGIHNAQALCSRGKINEHFRCSFIFLMIIARLFHALMITSVHTPRSAGTSPLGYGILR